MFSLLISAVLDVYSIIVIGTKTEELLLCFCCVSIFSSFEDLMKFEKHVCMKRGRERKRRERKKWGRVNTLDQFGLESFLITQLLECTWLEKCWQMFTARRKIRKLIVYPSVIKNIISEFTVNLCVVNQNQS